jgi:hypothetical protein
MRKIRLTIIISLAVAVAVISSVFAMSVNDQYEPEDFIGIWSATEYIETNMFQTSDFYREKYLGNHIYITSDSYYSEHYAEGDDMPKIIDHYFIKEVTDNDLQFWYRIHLSDLNVTKSSALALCYVRSGESSDDVFQEVGIVLDRNHLICVTGSGWYVYTREQ